MKILKWFLVSVMVSLLFFIPESCRKDEIAIPCSIDRLNWSGRNFEVLNNLISDYGVNGKYYNKNKAPYVVLDWDQTCAHFDVEEALFHYQSAFLKFRFTKEQFTNEILKDNINGILKLSESYQNVLLADINQDLSNDYNFLVDHFSGFNGTMTPEEIRLTPQYKDFIAKISFLYDGYCDTPGISSDYGYPWVLYLLSGYTVTEVKKLAEDAISYELANKISSQTWQSPSGFKTNSGVVSYSFHTGLRVFSEMQNLISTFINHGFDVFIVSASYKPVVEVFSGIGTFGYNVPAENIIAMELKTDGNGILLPQYKEGWVKSTGQGKVDAINRVIKTGLGRNWDPVFSAGDSDGDYEMLTGFPGMRLTLIWNRVKGGNIGKLCKQAVDEINRSNPRYLLQGRNENTGMAIPYSESILFGKTEPELLYQSGK